MVAHFYVKFGGPSYIGYWDIVQKNRQSNAGLNPWFKP